MSMSKGKWMVFEGVDGTGKTSTALEMIKEVPNCTMLRNPALADSDLELYLIRQKARNKSASLTEIYTWIAGSVYVAEQAQELTKTYDWVIVDRWLPSVAVYQLLSYRQQKTLLESIVEMEVPLPHLMVHFSLSIQPNKDIETIQERLKERGESILSRDQIIEKELRYRDFFRYNTFGGVPYCLVFMGQPYKTTTKVIKRHMERVEWLSK